MQESMSFQNRLRRARSRCHERRIKQVDIAIALGASQSQVSRILGGKSNRESRLANDVIRFVEQFDIGVTAAAVRSEKVLIDALRVAWDGSVEHAQALAVVIRSLAGLERRNKSNGQE